MDKEDQDVRAVRDDHTDFLGLLGDSPMTVVETPGNTKLINFWTYDRSDGYRYAYRTNL